MMTTLTSRVQRMHPRALDVLLWASPVLAFGYLYEEQRQPLLPSHELAIALRLADTVGGPERKRARSPASFNLVRAALASLRWPKPRISSGNAARSTAIA